MDGVQILNSPTLRRWSHLFARIHRVGALATLSRWTHRAAWTAFEKVCQLETGGSIEGAALGHSAGSFGYQPIDCQSFLKALARCRTEHDEVFVDYGCGKGRALLLAALFPLRQVIGVERSAELCTVAERNVTRALRWLQCRNVSIVEQDATEYALPDNATLLFFYNPFSGAVLDAVLERVRASLRRRPRSLRIIYALPKSNRDVMAETSWLRVQERVVTASRDWQRLTIYCGAES
jgi:precorrin-6B methylase 2